MGGNHPWMDDKWVKGSIGRKLKLLGIVSCPDPTHSHEEKGLVFFGA